MYRLLVIYLFITPKKRECEEKKEITATTENKESTTWKDSTSEQISKMEIKGILKGGQGWRWRKTLGYF